MSKCLCKCGNFKDHKFKQCYDCSFFVDCSKGSKCGCSRPKDPKFRKCYDCNISKSN